MASLIIDLLTVLRKAGLNCLLTEVSQAIGYFLAGACAGIASRTATAPLDRLKVYLIAQTSSKDAAVGAAKDGSPVKAGRHFGRPLIDALKDLWAAGGVRSLFAGMQTRPLQI
jgi:solute carrier family 25 (mitochondrial phosphate transporter), member 23/24/25/41